MKWIEPEQRCTKWIELEIERECVGLKDNEREIVPESKGEIGTKLRGRWQREGAQDNEQTRDEHVEVDHDDDDEREAGSIDEHDKIRENGLICRE